jgi:predicted branched-subunit amino acid permease
MSRNEAVAIRAFALWTVWVWGTRVGNVIGDDARSTAFKVVHVALAAVSVVFAIGAWIVVRRVRRRELAR